MKADEGARYIDMSMSMSTSMSRSLLFTDLENVIAVNYSKRRYPSKGYSQSFLNIQVTQTGQSDPFLDVDLDDDYSFLNYQNLN